MLKPRSYADYTLDHLQTICGINNRKCPLNLGGQAVEVSSWLNQSLEFSKMVPLNTEKAKSEWLIAPILSELARRNLDKFNLFSGNTGCVPIWGKSFITQEIVVGARHFC